MQAKELFNFRRKMFDEIIKNKEVKEALKLSDIAYIYDIREKSKRQIIVLISKNHLHENFLSKNSFTNNATIELIYIVNRNQKICY